MVQLWFFLLVQHHKIPQIRKNDWTWKKCYLSNCTRENKVSCNSNNKKFLQRYNLRAGKWIIELGQAYYKWMCEYAFMLTICYGRWCYSSVFFSRKGCLKSEGHVQEQSVISPFEKRVLLSQEKAAWPAISFRLYPALQLGLGRNGLVCLKPWGLMYALSFNSL